MTKHLLTIFIITAITAANAQDVSQLLTEVMDNARANSYQQVQEQPLYDSANAGQVLTLLQPYYSDSVESVRSKAYRITKSIGVKNSEPTIRIQAVGRLLQGCQDPSSGIAGIAARALANFNKDDFDQINKNALAALVKPKTAHLDRVLLLVGFVELTNQRGVISNMLLADTVFNDKSKWAAHLALARMGVTQEVGYVLSKVKRYPVNDDVVYELLPDLAYIRQPAAVDYLFEVINSDQQSCESADPESSQKILCGYRVMEYLAPIIEGFPYQIDDSGDLIVDDYRQALLNVRQWYTQNSNYVINKDTF